jgi:hypothetical protein
MNSLKNSSKRFVNVIADHTTDGRFRPRFIEWGNGQAVKIDQIAAVQAHRSGESLRYTCRVRDQWMYVVLPRACGA